MKKINKKKAGWVPVGAFGLTRHSVRTSPYQLYSKRGGIISFIPIFHIFWFHGRPFDSESPMDHWLRRNGHISVQKLAELNNAGADGQGRLEFSSENGLLK